MIIVNKVFDGGFDIKMTGTGDTLVDEYVSLTEFIIRKYPVLFEGIDEEMKRRAGTHDNDPGEH